MISTAYREVYKSVCLLGTPASRPYNLSYIKNNFGEKGLLSSFWAIEVISSVELGRVL
jgi:hypothetical protein